MSDRDDWRGWRKTLVEYNRRPKAVTLPRLKLLEKPIEETEREHAA